MIEKWKKFVGKEKTFAGLLTDPFKAFYCLLDDLIIANSMLMGLVYQLQG